MARNSSYLALLFLFFLAVSSNSTAAFNPKKFAISDFTLLESSPSPTTYFQVKRPIPTPPGETCSLTLLRHDFAYTLGKPAVTAPYAPPPRCFSRHVSPTQAVLTWRAASRGRQFDRIFGIWVDGVELLRSCTAEPRSTGIEWSVEKDVSRYLSLFRVNRTVSVFLGNVVDGTYTGVYHVNLTLSFYLGSGSGFVPGADLIIPISRDPPPDDGQWFVIRNATDSSSKKVVVPVNAYRAVVEVYVSPHGDDEFWYANPPEEYILANNLTATPGNGAFREVTVSVDGAVTGAVWPFPVIYTGGVNPLLWRPITGIGSFDLPSYDIEITPFLGNLLDGDSHEFRFAVTNAVSYWYVDANLHVWVDGMSLRTTGELIKHEAKETKLTVDLDFNGLDGNFLTAAERRISAVGWVASSRGNVTARTFQKLRFRNEMRFGNGGADQTVNQTVDWTDGEAVRRFPLYLVTETGDETDGRYSLASNVSMGFEERRFGGGYFADVRDRQRADGVVVVEGNLVKSGSGRTVQEYRYRATDGCYFRKVGAYNYTVLFDESSAVCARRPPSPSLSSPQ